MLQQERENDVPSVNSSASSCSLVEHRTILADAIVLEANSSIAISSTSQAFLEVPVTAPKFEIENRV